MYGQFLEECSGHIPKSAIKIQSHIRINVEYETGNDLIMELAPPTRGGFEIDLQNAI